MDIDHLYLQVFEDHQDSIHNIAAFANKKFEAFEEFSGQVFANIGSGRSLLVQVYINTRSLTETAIN